MPDVGKSLADGAPVEPGWPCRQALPYRYAPSKMNITTTDRKATAEEVRAHAPALRRLAADSGLGTPKLRDDGTLVVHCAEPGYREVLKFAARAAAQVGTYVHVIADDAPAARGTSQL